jgi:hypothetical protein
MINTGCNASIRRQSQIEILTLPNRVHQANRIEHKHVLSQIITSLLFDSNISNCLKKTNKQLTNEKSKNLEEKVASPDGGCVVSNTNHNGAFFEFITLHFDAMTLPSLTCGSNIASSGLCFVAKSRRCNCTNSSYRCWTKAHFQPRLFARRSFLHAITLIALHSSTMPINDNVMLFVVEMTTNSRR